MFLECLLLFDIGSDGVDGKSGEAFVRPDFRDQILAVLLRHPHVGQDQIEREGAGLSQ